MAEVAMQAGGSRFLKQPFDYAHAVRVEATERIMEMQFATVEKRLWTTVFGVVGVILAEAAQSLLTFGTLGR